MVPSSHRGLLSLKFFPFQTSHLPLLPSPAYPFLKAMLSKLTSTGGATMNNTVQGNTDPRDHLQVTSSHQRDPDIHQIKVSKIEDISPTVKKLVLHTDVRPVPFAFKAGQWVDVFIPGVEKVGGFSMTSSPTHLKNTGNLNLAVKYSEHSPASWVHKSCRVGSPLSIRVGGNFFVDFDSLAGTKDRKERLLFIAGGVGINPLTSMVAEMQSRKLSCKLKSVLLFSAKTQEELLFQEELDEVANDDCDFKPFYFLTGKSEPNGIPYPSNFKQERIDYETLNRIVTDELDLKPNSQEIFDKLHVYICGPPEFITSMESSLSQLGAKKIFFENWWQ